LAAYGAERPWKNVLLMFVMEYGGVGLLKVWTFFAEIPFDMKFREKREWRLLDRFRPTYQLGAK